MSIQFKELAKLKGLDFLAKYVVEGFITGQHRSPFHGFSVEFAEHKLYNPGDNTKHIDWRLFARTDRMYLKKFQEETNLRCHIVIDTSGSMYYQGNKNELSKIEFSAYAAASLIDLFKRQRDASSLNFINEQIEFQSPCKTSVAHLNLLYSKLDELLAEKGSPQKETQLSENLNLLAQTFPKRGLVIVFTDLFDNAADTKSFEQALQHLHHKGHEVIVFNVTSKKYEEAFEFENRPYTFVDMETGSKVKLNPEQVKGLYKQNITAFLKEMRLICTRYKADLIEADTAGGFDAVLSAYLHKRKKMR
jgi:uncharacterized protein (DUF58 family)